MTPSTLGKLSDELGRLAALHRYQILDTNPEREFDHVVGLLKTVLNTPMAFISFIDADRQWLKAAAGGPRGQTPRSLTFCDHTIRSMMPLAVPDARRDPRFETNPFVVAEGGIRCYLGAPLTTPDGYNVGTLCIAGTEARTFSETDSEILAGFAQLVVTQLEMRMLARRDALTGTLTRRAFEEHLRVAIEGADDDRPPMSLLLIDIDHFKFVNDRFGHQAGDQVLKDVAKAIEATLRTSDRLGRLGGEEFAVLMPTIMPADALLMAERIRSNVAALACPDLQGHRITISSGLAHWHRCHTGPEGWTLAADVALYSAKRAGRNRVVLARRDIDMPAAAVGAAA